MRKSATQRRSGIQISRVSVLPGKSHIIRIPGEAEDSRFPAAATATTTTTRPRAPPEGCKAAAETSLVNNESSSSSSNPRVHCQRDPQVRHLGPRSIQAFSGTSFGATIILGLSSRGPSRKRQKAQGAFPRLSLVVHILYIHTLQPRLLNLIICRPEMLELCPLPQPLRGALRRRPTRC